MPVLAQIRARFERERPLSGVSAAACLHVTAETACLMRTLQSGGATVSLCSANPLSAQDDVAAALVLADGVEVRARHGESTDAVRRPRAGAARRANRRSRSTTAPTCWSRRTHAGATRSSG